MWYDNSKILSFNRVLNMTLGNRGGGKTFASLKWCINDFLKHDRQFVWCRRYKAEMKRAIKGDEGEGGFFDAISSFYPDNKLEVKGDKALIDGKVAGYLIPLTLQQSYKSKNFPKVNKLIIDEYLVKGRGKYLPNEVHEIFELYETIDRSRDEVRMHLIANNISSVNPIFTYFNIKPNPDKRFNIYNDLIVEYFYDVEFIEKKNNTRFGKMIQGTTYGDYNISNKALNDKESFIYELPKGLHCSMVLSYLEHNFGVYYDYKGGYIYISKKFNKSCPTQIAITKEDHTVNHLMLDVVRNSQSIVSLKRYFDMGLMRFTDQLAKQYFFDIRSLLGQ